jgi:hypothetical protein
MTLWAYERDVQKGDASSFAGQGVLVALIIQLGAQLLLRVVTVAGHFVWCHPVQFMLSLPQIV